MRSAAKKPSRALSAKRLKDRIRPGLRVLFVGINPGLRSAATGHHFAGYSNRFWKLLFESQLVSEPLAYQDDWRLPDWGLGLTNIIQRPSAGIDAIKPSEYTVGRRRLLATVTRYRPRIVALLGVTIYRALLPDTRGQRIRLGLQARTIGQCAGVRPSKSQWQKRLLFIQSYAWRIPSPPQGSRFTLTANRAIFSSPAKTYLDSYHPLRSVRCC